MSNSDGILTQSKPQQVNEVLPFQAGKYQTSRDEMPDMSMQKGQKLSCLLLFLAWLKWPFVSNKNETHKEF